MTMRLNTLLDPKLERLIHIHTGYRVYIVCYINALQGDIYARPKKRKHRNKNGSRQGSDEDLLDDSMSHPSISSTKQKNSLIGAVWVETYLRIVILQRWLYCISLISDTADCHSMTPPMHQSTMRLLLITAAPLVCDVIMTQILRSQASAPSSKVIEPLEIPSSENLAQSRPST